VAAAQPAQAFESFVVAARTSCRTFVAAEGPAWWLVVVVARRPEACRFEDRNSSWAGRSGDRIVLAVLAQLVAAAGQEVCPSADQNALAVAGGHRWVCPYLDQIWPAVAAGILAVVVHPWADLCEDRTDQRVPGACQSADKTLGLAVAGRKVDAAAAAAAAAALAGAVVDIGATEEGFWRSTAGAVCAGPGRVSGSFSRT